MAWQRKFFKIDPGQPLLKELMKYYEIINFRTSSSYFSRETRGDLSNNGRSIIRKFTLTEFDRLGTLVTSIE